MRDRPKKSPKKCGRSYELNSAYYHFVNVFASPRPIFVLF